jgi:hypothetical protein
MVSIQLSRCFPKLRVGLGLLPAHATIKINAFSTQLIKLRRYLLRVQSSIDGHGKYGTYAEI